MALVSGRIFVGPHMSRNEEYINSIIMFSLNVFYSVPSVRKYPPPLRWLAKYLEPNVRECWKSLDTMKRLMAPIVAENKRRIDERDAPPPTMSVWNLRNSNAKEWASLTIQAQMQLSTSMAAIHTTTMTVTNALFDLAARPEYVAPLRAEIAAVRATEAATHMTKTSMPKCVKLDSFLKESHRLSPISLLNMRRKIVRPVTLHDGTTLPAGTHIAFPLAQVAQDPALWHEPQNFDGFRFARLREQPGNAKSYQFVATGTTNLDFGHGTHACPGRFFAANEIKMILIHFLENYDVKFHDGVTRPGNIWTPGGYYPDPTVKLLIRKRRDA